MKKSKLLVGVVALSVALMGTGYAWWTEAVVATGTAQTGNMDVQITSASLNKVSETNDKYLNIGSDIEVVNDKSVDFTLAGLYPKSTAKLSVAIQNKGTMGVVLNNVSIVPNLAATGNVTDTEQLLNVLKFAVVPKDATPLDSDYGTLSELQAKFKDNKIIGTAEITPGTAGAGEVKTFDIYIHMPEGLGAGVTNPVQRVENNANVTVFEENKEFEDITNNTNFFTCTMDFVQFNKTTN